MSIKTRKLFAILVITLMILTMLPMSAIAETQPASRFTSQINVDRESTTTGSTEMVKVTVDLMTAGYSATPGTIWFATSRGVSSVAGATVDYVTTAGILAARAVTFGTESNNNIQITIPAGGKGEFYLTSNVVGATKIAAGIPTVAIGGLTATSPESIYNFVNSMNSSNAVVANIISEGNAGGAAKTITFTAGAANAITKASIATNFTPFTDSVLLGTTTAAIATGARANGVDYYELEVRALRSGVPVANAEINFSGPAGVNFDNATKTTNALGYAKVKVTSSSVGNKTITAKVGTTAEQLFYFNFAAAQTANLEVVLGNDVKFAAGTSHRVRLKLYDAAGSQVTYTGANTSGSGLNGSIYGIRLETLEKPADAAMPPAIHGDTTQATWISESNGLVQLDFPAAWTNKNGTYKVRASLVNGKYVDFVFNRQTQGPITRIGLDYGTSAIPAGTTAISNNTSGNATVYLYDSENVRDAGVNSGSLTSDFVFASSDNSLASVNNAAGSRGIVTTNNNSKTGTVTITVTDTARNLVATYDFAVEGLPAAVVLTPQKANPVMGTAATVDVQIVDQNGKAVGDRTMTANNFMVNVITKPAGSSVETVVASNMLTTVTKNGKTSFTVSSNQAGEVLIRVTILTIGGGITATTSMNFVETAVEDPATPAGPAYGAASVTMFIGSKGFVVDGAGANVDVAPFIEGGRTFVPVRFIADAFGVEDEDMTWGPEGKTTEWVKLARPDKTISITIGSTALEVEENGKVTTITMDTAAFIRNGRTFLPFRYLAQAFGAEVDYGPKDAPVEWVTFKQ